jgi:hypothetical protein
MIKSRTGWAEHVVRIIEIRKAYKILVGKKKQRKKTTWKTWRRWEDNITIDLKETGWEVADCTGSG